jgi:dipeptidase D
MDIHKGLGNANKIMNRLLSEGQEKFKLQVSEVNGGSLRNAIPRESVARVVVPKSSSSEFVASIKTVADEIKAELKTMEPGLNIQVSEEDLPSFVMEPASQKAILAAIYAAPNGVYRMSADIPGLVETSNNIARIIIKDGEISIACLTRSSVETSKYDLANALRAAFELAGCSVTFSGGYPGWTPNLSSPIVNLLVTIYEKQHQKKPAVVACHAGLECGILGTNYPSMDMVSFGPTIKGAHSPDERASVSSTQKFWKYLLEILKNIPAK